MNTINKRIVVAITGASGAILGIRLLEHLNQLKIETHLVLSKASRLTIKMETEWNVDQIQKLSHTVYQPDQLSAAIASGSFATDGMVIIPCSIKTLSAVANSFSHNLITRAADVTLKEGRPLLLVVRETPLHLGHLRLMVQASENGAVVFPPVPAFYTQPNSVAEIIDNLTGRILARLGLPNNYYQEWQGDGS